MIMPMKFTQINRSLLRTLGFVATVGISVNAGAVMTVDPNLPEYQKASGISGNLSSVGSDTLANLMTLWAEEFNRLYPNVNIQIQAAGSSTAPPALTEGTSNLGPMSREMKDDEIEEFEDKYGYKPTAIPVAVDALADRAESHSEMTQTESQELRDRVRARSLDLLDEWARIAMELDQVGGRLQYQLESGGARRLLYEFLNPELKSLPLRHRKFRANRSMRDVEPSVNLWLKTMEGVEIEEEDQP